MLERERICSVVFSFKGRTAKDFFSEGCQVETNIGAVRAEITIREPRDMPRDIPGTAPVQRLLQYSKRPEVDPNFV